MTTIHKAHKAEYNRLMKATAADYRASLIADIDASMEYIQHWGNGITAYVSRHPAPQNAVAALAYKSAYAAELQAVIDRANKVDDDAELRVYRFTIQHDDAYMVAQSRDQVIVELRDQGINPLFYHPADITECAELSPPATADIGDWLQDDGDFAR